MAAIGGLEKMDKQMKKMMIYSHDSFGFSNLERILSITERLLNSDPDLSVLVVSGSPMMDSFRVPDRFDYIKLPSLQKSGMGASSTHGFGMTKEEVNRLRSGLVLAAVKTFQPDLFLVDKMPTGMENELSGVLRYLKICSPQTKQVLLVGDLLDTAEETVETWETVLHHQSLQRFYDMVLLTGSPEAAFFEEEVQFPEWGDGKARYCVDLGAIKKISQLILTLLINARNEGSNPPYVSGFSHQSPLGAVA